MICAHLWNIFEVPREGDVVDGGKDFLVGYHVVDPFHQSDHVPDPRNKIINIVMVMNGDGDAWPL